MSDQDSEFDAGFIQGWREALEEQARTIGRLIGMVSMDDIRRRQLLRQVRETMTKAAAEERKKRP